MLYIFVSYLMIVRELGFSHLKSRKNLVFYTVKLTYIVTGSAICLKLRTDYI